MAPRCPSRRLERLPPEAAFRPEEGPRVASSSVFLTHINIPFLSTEENRLAHWLARAPSDVLKYLRPRKASRLIVPSRPIATLSFNKLNVSGNGRNSEPLTKNITHDVLRLADLVRCPVAHLLLDVIVDGGVGVH